MADPFDYWPFEYWPKLEIPNSSSFSEVVTLLPPDPGANVVIHSAPLLVGSTFTAELLDENGAVIPDINILNSVTVTAIAGGSTVTIEGNGLYDFGGAVITAFVNGQTRTYYSASAVPPGSIITFFDTPETVASVVKFTFPITYSVDDVPGTEGDSIVYLMLLNDYETYATQFRQLLGI